MKSKKDILDKYEQGEFTNYKNESPPKTLKDYDWNIVGTAATEYAKADRKAEAVAFGEWILKHDSYPITNDKWLVARGKDPVTGEEAYEYFTTEELYNEFLKSV